MKVRTALRLLFAVMLIGFAMPPEPLQAIEPERAAALEEKKAAHEGDPDNAGVAASYAIALLQAGQYEQAERVVGRWDKLDPVDPRLKPARNLLQKWKQDPDPRKQLFYKTEFAVELRDVLREQMQKLGAEMDDLSAEYDKSTEEISQITF